ncbi:MAG: hypothetical protein GXX78_13060 [Bacteroidales bacterium]|nr:hypothetical protein [Bacteroidales bacterium]
MKTKLVDAHLSRFAKLMTGLLCCFFLSFTPAMAQSIISPQERAALISLFNATGGSQWTNRMNWTTNAPESQWWGLTIEGGHVTAIVLQNNNLVGTIPPEIGNFPALRILDLSGNKLTGGIPSEIGGLTTLQQLLLQSNQLSGSIPLNLYNLTNLVTLNIFKNQLTGNISGDISKMISLQTLNLSENQLSGNLTFRIGDLDSLLTSLNLSYNQFNSFIPQAIGDLEKLTSLDLSNNSFSGAIPPELGNLVNLKTLSLGTNNLRGSIPVTIFSLTKLEGLYLNKNSFTPAPLSDLIGNLVNLRYLNLEGCNFTGDLPQTIGNLNKLMIFNISNNKFTGRIPDAFANFILSDFRINDNLISYIPTMNYVSSTFYSQNNLLGFDDLEPNAKFNSLGSYFIYWPQGDFCPEKTYYSLVEGNTFSLQIACSGTQNSYTWYKNNVLLNANNSDVYSFGDLEMDDSGQYHITVASALLPKLTLKSCQITLDVREHCMKNDSSVLVAFYQATGGVDWINNDNWLTGPVKTWYGIEADSCNVLEINLPNNNLTKNVPVEISGLDKLEVLALPGNNLVKDNPNKEIQPEIWNITTLRELDLSRNYFEQQLPGSIGNLTSLTSLRLAGNALGGPIPPEIEHLTALQVLALDSNAFSGNIPPEIFSLTKLQYLGMSNNGFNGALPTSWGALPLLRWLALNNNGFTGTIPSSIWTLSNLQMLDLSDNDFRGTLPPEIGNLTQLVKFGAGNNQLDGAIPEEITNWTQIEHLNLGKNSFTGELPTGIGDFSRLKYADFSENGFTGDLPANMSMIAPLDFLYINDNYFENISPLLQIDSVFLCQDNNLTFEDLEPNTPLQRKNNLRYEYAQQRLFNEELWITVVEGNPYTLTIPCGGQYNHYTWYKDDGQLLSGPDSSSLVFPSLRLEDTGKYFIDVVNDSVTDESSPLTNLELRSYPVHLFVIEHCLKYDSLALVDFYHATQGANWVNNENWLVKGTRLDDWFGVTTDSCNVLALELVNNNLEGELIDSVGSLLYLETLNLQQNNLSGTIPDDLYNLTNLKLLNLSKNELTGGLSSKVGALTQLETLKLNNNALSQSLPSELGTLRRVEIIDLSYNGFTGSLPSSLDGLSAIQYFNAGANQLSGNLPESIWDMVTVKQLLLFDNDLDGALSPSVGKLVAMNEFRIDSNYFDGEIPAVLGQMNNLSGCHLNVNEFYEMPQMYNIDSVLYCQYNYLTFEDLERNVDLIGKDQVDFQYIPQYEFGREYDTIAFRKYPFTLSIPCGGEHNHYQWYKDGELLPGAPDSSVLFIPRVDYSDAGEYYITVTNDIIPGLTLKSRVVTVNVEKGPPLPLSLINLVIIDGSHEPGFIIENIDDYPENRLQVFTRWGKVAYDKSGYNNELDCSVFPEGTYYFVLTYNSPQGKQVVKNFVDVIKK